MRILKEDDDFRNTINVRYSRMLKGDRIRRKSDEINVNHFTNSEMTRAAVIILISPCHFGGWCYIRQRDRKGRADNFNGAATQAHKVIEEARRRSPIHPALVPETDKTVDTP